MAATSTTMSVLLIEPDMATRQLYARALRQYWDVTAVRTIEEAVAALRTGMAPSVIVVEPYAGDSQIDWQTLSLLRSSSHAQPVIVFCTTLDERGKGQAWGAALYLLKPVSAQQLVTELSTVLM